jgi:hypothetical protein
MSDSTLKRPISDKQHAANFRNAAWSTGPASTEGKTRACMNNYRHGMRSRVVLPRESQQERPSGGSSSGRVPDARAARHVHEVVGNAECRNAVTAGGIVRPPRNGSRLRNRFLKMNPPCRKPLSGSKVAVKSSGLVLVRRGSPDLDGVVPGGCRALRRSHRRPGPVTAGGFVRPPRNGSGLRNGFLKMNPPCRKPLSGSKVAVKSSGLVLVRRGSPDPAARLTAGLPSAAPGDLWSRTRRGRETRAEQRSVVPNTAASGDPRRTLETQRGPCPAGVGPRDDHTAALVRSAPAGSVAPPGMERGPGTVS